jgi:hypothetical protein
VNFSLPEQLARSAGAATAAAPTVAAPAKKWRLLIPSCFIDFVVLWV